MPLEFPDARFSSRRRVSDGGGKPHQRENSPTLNSVEYAALRRRQTRGCGERAAPNNSEVVDDKQASEWSKSIERSEFCCEDNGKNTPGNVRKGVIHLMDL